MNPDWKGPKRIVLEDYGTEDAAYRWLKGGSWVGGICYDIITKKSKGKKVYTLLTFRPGRSYHTKYIDAVELGSSRKQLHFGSRIFNIRSNGDERYARRPYRIQFRYNSALQLPCVGTANTQDKWNTLHLRRNLKENGFPTARTFLTTVCFGKKEMADSGSLSARSKPRGSANQWKGTNYLGSKKIIAECID